MTAVAAKSKQKNARPRKPNWLEQRIAAPKRKVAAKKAHAIRVAAPYAALPAAGAMGGLYAGSWYPLVAGASMTAAIAADRVREAKDWHRQGGKAAARKRRKYQGEPTVRELRRALSVPAARKSATFTRPALQSTRRLSATQAGVVIGQPARRGPAELVARFEDFLTVYAPARGGKTRHFLARALHDFPGAALSTSTRVDVYAHTVRSRKELAEAHGGRVWVLNPYGDGLIKSDFRWSPLAGCHLFPLACDAAGYLMGAAPKDPNGGDKWIDDMGCQLLRVMMHAAAIGGGDMMTVRDWVRHPAAREPMDVLKAAGDPEAARSLAAILAAEGGTFRQSVSVTAASALSFLDHPVMRWAACPPPGEGLDVWDFLETCSTVYLVGTDKDYNALTRYFSCFAGHLFDRAKQHASLQPGQRLDPPLGLVIDEPALTCRVPLPQWSAEAGGHGITVVTGFQSFAQGPARWGEHDARTLMTNSTVIVMGGFKADDELERISAVCGDIDTWHHVTGDDGSKTQQPSTVREWPPNRIRALRGAGEGQDPEALLLYRSLRPVKITLPSVTTCDGYSLAPTGIDTLPAHAPAEPAAITAGPPAITECHEAGDIGTAGPASPDAALREGRRLVKEAALRGDTGASGGAVAAFEELLGSRAKPGPGNSAVPGEPVTSERTS